MDEHVDWGKDPASGGKQKDKKGGKGKQPVYTKEEFNEFKKLNDAYKKFGFPFIFAVKGKSKIEILNNFRTRINSKPQIEFEEAIRQVKKIASLRLEDLNNKNI